MDEAALQQWAQDLADRLDLDVEVDVTAVLALAATAAHTVIRPAAPVSTYLAGLLAGRAGVEPAEALERLEQAVGEHSRHDPQG